MSAMASQVAGLTIIYSNVYSGAHRRKHQSSASLACVKWICRWPVNSPHKGPVTRKMFPFDDVIMISFFILWYPRLTWYICIYIYIYKLVSQPTELAAIATPASCMKDISRRPNFPIVTPIRATTIDDFTIGVVLTMARVVAAISEFTEIWNIHFVLVQQFGFGMGVRYTENYMTVMILPNVPNFWEILVDITYISLHYMHTSILMYVEGSVHTNRLCTRRQFHIHTRAQSPSMKITSISVKCRINILKISREINSKIWEISYKKKFITSSIFGPSKCRFWSLNRAKSVASLKSIGMWFHNLLPK